VDILKQFTIKRESGGDTYHYKLVNDRSEVAGLLQFRESRKSKSYLLLAHKVLDDLKLRGKGIMHALQIHAFAEAMAEGKRIVASYVPSVAVIQDQHLQATNEPLRPFWIGGMRSLRSQENVINDQGEKYPLLITDIKLLHSSSQEITNEDFVRIDIKAASLLGQESASPTPSAWEQIQLHAPAILARAQMLSQEHRYRLENGIDPRYSRALTTSLDLNDLATTYLESGIDPDIIATTQAELSAVQ
jgi:predicted GNAT family acetyltransferase